jgi:serine protease Do
VPRLTSAGKLGLALGLLAAGCNRGPEPAAAEAPGNQSETEPATRQLDWAIPVSSAVAATVSKSRGVTPRVGVPPVAEQLTRAFAGAAQAVRASVVRVDVESALPLPGLTRDQTPPEFKDFFDGLFEFGVPAGNHRFAPPPVRRGTGSGFVIDSDGHVVTNSHVVEAASAVTIRTLDGQELSARVIGRDPLTDLAVLAVQNPKHLTVARVGDARALRIGQWVLAVGSPLGVEQSVTAGIVSGLGRTGGRVRMSGERVRRYIQTDTSINPGNSGGPLVNLAGEVVGVNTLTNVGPGGPYGFAIPINDAQQVARTLVEQGRVRYPYIGVQVAAVDDLSAEARRLLDPGAPRDGAYVSAVAPDGPAAKAGLHAGDIVLEIDGKPIRDATGLVDAVSGRSIGAQAALTFWRDGKQQRGQVQVGELPGGQEPPEAGPRLGVGLQTLTEDLGNSLGLPADVKRGAVVTEIQPNGPAARAGLAVGDVVVEINRQEVASAWVAAQALRAGGIKRHLLRVMSGGRARFVTMTPQ